MANWIIKERTYMVGSGKRTNHTIDTFNAKDLESARRTLYKMVRHNQNEVNDMNGIWYVLYKVTPKGYTEIGQATGMGMSMLWISPKTKGESYLYKDGTIGKNDKEGPRW